MSAYIVTVEVNPKGSKTHPSEWFWTDVCPTPDDEIRVTHIEEAEPDGS